MPLAYCSTVLCPGARSDTKTLSQCRIIESSVGNTRRGWHNELGTEASYTMLIFKYHDLDLHSFILTFFLTIITIYQTLSPRITEPPTKLQNRLPILTTPTLQSTRSPINHLISTQRRCPARDNPPPRFRPHAPPRRRDRTPKSQKTGDAAAAPATGPEATSNATTRTAAWDGITGNASG